MKLDSTDQAMSSVPSIPRDQDGPVFAEPWQAEVFSMTLALYEKGLFTWPEWADILARCIRNAQQQGDADLGDTYYLHWLDALESLLEERSIAAPGELSGLYQRWKEASESTPHGQPIELRD